MNAPALRSQPKGERPPLLDRLRLPRVQDSITETYAEAADRIEGLEARAEKAERSVDVLESNARVQAKLLADTGRRVEELEAVLTEILAIDGHGYAVAPMGFALRTRATAALPQSRGEAR
jgi:hypothetical protein